MSFQVAKTISMSTSAMPMRNADAECDLLRPGPDRSAPDSLHRIEHQMAAIKYRNRHQIQKSNGNRQNGGKLKHGGNTQRRHLARCLRNADRPAPRIGPPSWSAFMRPLTRFDR